jgi:phytoene dehydrogenase-like protein
MTDRAAAIAALQRALDDTDAEYAQLPLVVRLLVRRGFARRTGRDLAAWRALLAAAGDRTPPELPAALAALAAHYRGAPERARRGMGATGPQLAMIEARSRARAEAADALRAALADG